MASGVAHDFNNLLTAILVRAQLLRGQVVDDDARKELELIEKAAIDGANAIRRIQDFTRVRKDISFAPFGIRDALLDAIEFTRGIWGSDSGECGCEVVFGGCPRAAILGNVSEVREVFTNIILNGVESMEEEGGEMRISAIVDEGSVRLSFADEGAGMSGDVAEKIFDPFFTTKGEAGNGLGLSVAYGIVERHGGEISVDSSPGEGSTFCVSLPILEESVEVEDGGLERFALGEIRALVVDGDAMVRRGLAKLLGDLGWIAEEAANAEEALALVSEKDYDVVLADQMLKGTRGDELGRRIVLGTRCTKFMLMTGSTEDCGRDSIDDGGRSAVVCKPFRSVDLVSSLSELLRGPRDAGH
jgi:CheY-like chemotaxis protein